MTQEEKAKAYDRVSKEVKDFFEGKQKMYSDVTQTLEHLFSELKESEDERTWIINYLSNRELNSSIIAEKENLKKAIAWLEKQGEKDKLIKELGEYKVKYTKVVLEKHINNMSNKDDERLRNTTIAFLKDFAEQGYENAVECIDWLEKQGEQKPVEWKEDVIENLWHDASEEPNGKEYVIAWDGKYASIACYKSIVNCKWCYLSDILPNKEKGV